MGFCFARSLAGSIFVTLVATIVVAVASAMAIAVTVTFTVGAAASAGVAVAVALFIGDFLGLVAVVVNGCNSMWLRLWREGVEYSTRDCPGG